MASPLASSPSEGEILESDSDKATTSLVEPRNTSVDRPSRQRTTAAAADTASRSPSPSPPPRRRRRSRSSSRSPYRESRGSKRLGDDDHYDRGRNDPRRFKISYEDARPNNRREDRRRAHVDGYANGNKKSQHHSRYSSERSQERRSRRSLTPVQKDDRRHRNDRDRHREYREDRNSRHAPDSASARNQRKPDAGRSAASAESSQRSGRQKDAISEVIWRGKDSGRDEYVHRAAKTITPGNVESRVDVNGSSKPDDLSPPVDERPLDEAAIIEERRKRREAIKARLKTQQHLSVMEPSPVDNSSRQSTPGRDTSGQNSQIQVTNLTGNTPSPNNADAVSSPKTPQVGSPAPAQGPESPKDFVVTADSDLVNSNTLAPDHAQGDEPSAADYDPSMDMQEDIARQDSDRARVGSGPVASNMTSTQEKEGTTMETAAQPPPKANKSAELDMFGDDDDLDMFADNPVKPSKDEKDQSDAEVLPHLKALDVNMIDDWDDADGYYKIILGELFDNRYQIQSNLGKGMFSGVVRAMDQKLRRVVAIKIVRNNETMKKAGLKEIEILQKLSSADPDDKKHVVRLERCFEHKGHLCMVFENLSIDLREVLKKFGRDVGINLKAVREYARQMFLGLSLLRKCNILHADLKPDNILVNESRTTLKICDLGSAADASDGEITRYLVSRFYRAPEIILGLPYDFAVDMWSIGCTLFELYTGKILFTGRSNNQMLRAIMECRGKFNPKLVRRAEFANLYFDDLLNFRSVERDKLTDKDVVRVLAFNNKPTRDLKARLMANVKGVADAELRDINLFVDLLDRCLNLNPEKRCTPAEALKHPFIMRGKV